MTELPEFFHESDVKNRATFMSNIDMEGDHSLLPRVNTGPIILNWYFEIRRLLRELDAIEKKSEAMRRETERLRKMKNEAKHALAGRYPDLFGSKANFDTMSKT